MALCGGSKKPIQRKIVILGDGACGKTSLLNVFTRGYFPQVYEPTVFENYVHDIFVDGVPIQLSLWDTAGQEEFDRLRSLSYSDTHTIMLCFSVDSRDSLENVASKWVGEITDHCEGVKLVLVALKCDLRSQTDEPAVVKPRNPAPSDANGIEKSSTNTNNNISTQSTDSTLTNGNAGAVNGAANSSTNTRGLHAQSIVSEPAKKYITYEEGLAMAKRIGALRYLECSAKKNRGVNECFTEAARCALSAKPKGAAQDESESKSSSCVIS